MRVARRVRAQGRRERGAGRHRRRRAGAAVADPADDSRRRPALPAPAGRDRAEGDGAGEADLRAARRPGARRAAAARAREPRPRRRRDREPRRLDQAQATYETTAQATVPQEMQKAELDARAAKDALDAQQAIYDNRQRLLREGAIAEKDVNDARAALSQARSQYETAKKHVDDLQGFARDQQLKAAAAQRDAARGRVEAAAGAAWLLARHQPDRRRRHRSAALRRRNASERPAGRHGDGCVAGDRAHARLAGRSGRADGWRRCESDRTRRRAGAGEGDADQPGARRREHDGRSVGAGRQPRRHAAARHEHARRDDRENGARRARDSCRSGPHQPARRHLRDCDRQGQQAAPAQDRGRHPRRRQGADYRRTRERSAGGDDWRVRALQARRRRAVEDRRCRLRRRRKKKSRKKRDERPPRRARAPRALLVRAPLDLDHLSHLHARGRRRLRGADAAGRRVSDHQLSADHHRRRQRRDADRADGGVDHAAARSGGARGARASKTCAR